MNSLQAQILLVYKEVKDICDRHNIRYFAIGGTLLGAVRHKGFIPWDDDLDIAMPRNDYKRFIEIAKKELPPNIAIFNGAEEARSDFPYLKVHSKDSTFTSEILRPYKESYTGVFIDIMPVDGVPKGLLRDIYIKTLIFLVKTSYRRKLSKYDVPDDIDNKRLFSLYLKIIKLFPVKTFSFLHKTIASLVDFDKSEEVAFSWSWRLFNRVYSRDDFQSFVELQFEDTRVKAFNGYESYLTSFFGDYMKLPPVEQRTSKHEGLIDISRPYSYYAERLSKE